MNGDRVALDTNVAVQILNDVPNVIIWLNQFGSLLLPVPVIGELSFGARNSARAAENLSRLQRLLARCPAMPLDAEIGDVYGRLRLELKIAGRPIPENDLWIASACVQHQMPLVTLDLHFSVIPELVVLKPQAP